MKNKNTFLVITSIANQEHPVLKEYTKVALEHNIPFVVIGDTKSPKEFNLDGCDFYSIERQKNLNFRLAKTLPVEHYARKNLGYLIAISEGAEIIIETDDDNLPIESFWESRIKKLNAHLLSHNGWVNIYKYFTDVHALENVQDTLPVLNETTLIDCPIQQGLADGNPDVDAIYRLTLPLPIKFNKSDSIALGEGSFCPFNSQNTTWFKDAFPLLYLPSYCSFRMTDIWRSFVAQRIAWTCGWPILFHSSNVRQERNDHNLIDDFRDEYIGYCSNLQLLESLKALKLKEGVKNIPDNMKRCYEKLIELGFVEEKELFLLKNWLEDIYTHISLI